MNLAEKTVQILEQYVGHTAADTCIRGTAIACGKFSDTLSAEDLPAIEQRVRGLLAPVVPSATLDGILEEIREAAA